MGKETFGLAKPTAVLRGKQSFVESEQGNPAP